jgi:hypothetical protein
MKKFQINLKPRISIIETTNKKAFFESGFGFEFGRIIFDGEREPYVIDLMGRITFV